VVAETSKKHLEDRVDDLARQLQGNQEKLSVYERRPAAAGVAQHTEADLSREQQLEAEVAELRYIVIILPVASSDSDCRSALKVAEVDLATAKSHVQQFQEISQANESALATLNAVHDEYRASTEAAIARHEVCT
jgi:nucleoprotein TPR